MENKRTGRRRSSGNLRSSAQLLESCKIYGVRLRDAVSEWCRTPEGMRIVGSAARSSARQKPYTLFAAAGERASERPYIHPHMDGMIHLDGWNTTHVMDGILHMLWMEYYTCNGWNDTYGWMEYYTCNRWMDTHIMDGMLYL